MELVLLAVLQKPAVLSHVRVRALYVKRLLDRSRVVVNAAHFGSVDDTAALLVRAVEEVNGVLTSSGAFGATLNATAAQVPRSNIGGRVRAVEITTAT